MPKTTHPRLRLAVPLILITATSGLFLNLLSGAAGARPAASTASSTPSDSLVIFADQVQTLGQNSYPNSFAGAELNAQGQVIVYAVASDDTALLSDIAALNQDRYPVVISPTSLSYNQLDTLNNEITANVPQLATDGVQIESSAPDPASGTVTVTLMQPGIQATSALAQTIGTPVSSSNYIASATTLLTERFTDVSIDPVYGSPAFAAGRTNDTSPFSGGDQIYGGQYNAKCTSGFPVIDNGNGNIYMLGSGHCGNGKWYANPSKTTYLGAVSKLYWRNTYEDDFSTIYVNTQSTTANVWANGTSYHTINGQIVPAINTPMTFDGATSGEVPGNNVTAVDATIDNVYSSLCQCYYNIKYEIEAQNPSGTTICQGGDSGGPTYVREPTNPYAYAVGSITAYYTNSFCAAEEIGDELSHSDTSLIEG